LNSKGISETPLEREEQINLTTEGSSVTQDDREIAGNLNLSPNSLVVLKKRYLKKDDNGEVTEKAQEKLSEYFNQNKVDPYIRVYLAEGG